MNDRNNHGKDWKPKIPAQQRFGNQNAKIAGLWKKALRLQLDKYAENGVEKGQALNAIAKLCVADALSADADVRANARKEIADRLDGKAKEHVELEFTDKLAAELTDEQLLSIASGSSGGTSAETPSETDDSSVH